MNQGSKGRLLYDLIDDYVALDIETTGLDPRGCDIIELAAIRIRGSQLIESFSQLVKPSCGVSGFITRLTGISNDMLTDAPTICEALPHFIEFVGDDIILGHNVCFDIGFICDKAAKQNRFFDNDYIDTMRISRRLFPEHRTHKLDDLISRFQLEARDEHRALGDTLLTARCYEYMKRYMRRREIKL